MPVLGVPQDLLEEDARRRALEAMASGAVEAPAFVPLPAGPPTSRVAVASGVPQEVEPPPLDEYGEALAEVRRREMGHLGGDLGSGIIKAFTGVGRDPAMQQAMDAQTQAPVVEYLQRQKMADDKRRLDLTAQKAMPKPGALGKPTLSTDPSSPESRRYQAAFRAQYPGTPDDVLSAVTEANYDNFRVSLDARSGLQSREKLGADALGQREKDRLQRAYQFARTDARGWAALNQDEQQFFLNRVDREATAAAKAAKDSDGQTIPAGEAASIGQSKAAISALDTLGKQFLAKGASGVGGRAATFLPWDTDPKKYEDDVLAAAQAIGTILEGGKLAAGDEVKYRKLFPAAGDSAERARNKLDNVRRLVQDLTGAKVEALGAAGFNVKGFTPPKPTPTKAPVPPIGAGVGNRPQEPAGTAPPVAKKQYSKKANRTRELDAAGNVIREYEGPPHG